MQVRAPRKVRWTWRFFGAKLGLVGDADLRFVSSEGRNYVHGRRGPDLFIDIDRFHETFCADLPAEVAGPMSVSQRPLSGAALSEPATLAGWKDLPTWYMVSERDNAIPPDAERFMANRMDAETETIDGSHVAFIAHPEAAAGLILKAVAAV